MGGFIGGSGGVGSDYDVSAAGVDVFDVADQCFEYGLVCFCIECFFVAVDGQGGTRVWGGEFLVGVVGGGAFGFGECGFGEDEVNEVFLPSMVEAGGVVK